MTSSTRHDGPEDRDDDLLDESESIVDIDVEEYVDAIDSTTETRMKDYDTVTEPD